MSSRGKGGRGSRGGGGRRGGGGGPRGSRGRGRGDRGAGSSRDTPRQEEDGDDVIELPPAMNVSRLQRTSDQAVRELVNRPVPPAKRVGQAIQLVVNQFAFDFKLRVLFLYDIVFIPDVESVAARRRLIPYNAIGDAVFDGGKLLVCKNKLEENQFEVVGRDGQVRVELTLTRELRPSDPDVPIQFYNILLKKV